MPCWLEKCLSRQQNLAWIPGFPHGQEAIRERSQYLPFLIPVLRGTHLHNSAIHSRSGEIELGRTHALAPNLCPRHIAGSYSIGSLAEIGELQLRPA